MLLPPTGGEWPKGLPLVKYGSVTPRRAALAPISHQHKHCGDASAALVPAIPAISPSQHLLCPVAVDGVFCYPPAIEEHSSTHQHLSRLKRHDSCHSTALSPVARPLNIQQQHPRLLQVPITPADKPAVTAGLEPNGVGPSGNFTSSAPVRLAV